jgi:hypothetical protein
MIARREDSSAALSKASDNLTVFFRKTVTGVNSEKPQFVKVRTIYPT